MNDNIGRRILSLGLAIVLSVFTAFADSNSAMLRTTGVITINGTATNHSSAILAGDNLQTTANSRAVISAHGSMISILPNSSVTYRGDGIDVKDGVVQVATNSEMFAVVNSYKVTALQGSVKFQIVRNGYCSSVTAEQGSVVVTEGTSRNMVQQGTSLPLADQRCAVAAIAPTPAAGGGILSSTQSAYRSAMAVAGASTAVILLHQRNPTSPSIP